MCSWYSKNWIKKEKPKKLYQCKQKIELNKQRHRNDMQKEGVDINTENTCKPI